MRLVMYCKSAMVWPCRPIRRPESSVLTSRKTPSSKACSSTVASNPKSFRSCSSISLGCAGIIVQSLLHRAKDKHRVNSWLHFFLGHDGARFGGGGIRHPGHFGLEDAQQ